MTVEMTLNDVEATRAFGRALASQLRAGDLVMLSGELGAGKTTLTQGIGEGLGVRGAIASPTFIVARYHEPGQMGVGLIHADAYRITSLEDLATLDLEASLAECVVVVEWGRGLVEDVSNSRIEIDIDRASGSGVVVGDDGVVDLTGLDGGIRRVSVRALGERARTFDEGRLREAFVYKD